MRAKHGHTCYRVPRVHGHCVLEIGAIQILVMTHPTYDWNAEQFRSVGMVPGVGEVYRRKEPDELPAAYGDIPKAFLILDTPGPTPPTTKLLKFQRMPRPFLPFDENIPNLQPVILT